MLIIKNIITFFFFLLSKRKVIIRQFKHSLPQQVQRSNAAILLKHKTLWHLFTVGTRCWEIIAVFLETCHMLIPIMWWFWPVNQLLFATPCNPSAYCHTPFPMVCKPDSALTVLMVLGQDIGFSPLGSLCLVLFHRLLPIFCPQANEFCLFPGKQKQFR